MKNDLLKVRRWEDFYANYDIKYMAELTHNGLNEHRVLTDRDNDILENKISILTERWDGKWTKLYEKQQRESLISDLSEKAAYQDIEVKHYINDVENVLSLTLEVDDTINWEILKDRSTFSTEYPDTPVQPRRNSITVYTEPDPRSEKYIPKFTFWERLSINKKTAKQLEYRKLFEIDMADYESKSIREEERFKLRLQEFDLKLKEHSKACKQIDIAGQKFKARQQIANTKIDKFKENYLKLDTESIEKYCSLVLDNSNYPPQFPQSFELEYSSGNKSLIVDYWLPTLDDMPSVKEVKFIKSKQEIRSVAVSDSQRRRYFDSVVYQIVLRTIHELFEADSTSAIDIITFNGFVSFINKSTGKEETSCIVSLQSTKSEFVEIDLSRVDPKECFKGLKGVGSSKLYGLTPVKPLLKMDRNDSRIASHYSVVNDVDASVNLAAMDWEDFEHLVRELFAKEFSGEGSEVHVTRASRDGGVDAIAFDPDPIRGGKIVIQAKRYTNTVGVAAVRDLYGTVMNEGAIKGILVTTSNYGPDAYKFAKDKPLALLNGNNLLHLLMNHGVSAKIDLKEAKTLKQ